MINLYNIKHKILLFIGLILSNIICYYLFFKIYYTFENFGYKNSIIMNLYTFINISLFSFILLIFEFFSIFFLYIFINNFNILSLKKCYDKFYEKYAKYN